MILLIDNYDSFTYNLYDYFRQLELSVKVIKNDECGIAQIEQINPAAIVISPGPGRPEEAGLTLSIIKRFAGAIPLMGICLGHQAIAQAYGGQIIKAPQPVHGKIALITHDNKTIFAGLSQPLQVTRYHSLIVERATLPAQLEVSALTTDGLIMALRHKTKAIEAVQFHPEAILTDSGLLLLRRFVLTYTDEILIK